MTISNASENAYVVSNVHAGSGAATSNTGGVRHQANPAIILNDENGLQQPIRYSAEQYPSYMTIAAGQLQNSQVSRMSSSSSRGRYTSLHRGHTYETIGNSQEGVAERKSQNGFSKCATATILIILILILVVAMATLAIATFTAWFLISELKELKESLWRLESRNSTELVIEPDQLPETQVIKALFSCIIDLCYNRQ